MNTLSDSLAWRLGLGWPDEVPRQPQWSGIGTSFRRSAACASRLPPSRSAQVITSTVFEPPPVINLAAQTGSERASDENACFISTCWDARLCKRARRCDDDDMDHRMRCPHILEHHDQDQDHHQPEYHHHR
eukprot:3931834-Rhodomonas_salina.1